MYLNVFEWWWWVFFECNIKCRIHLLHGFPGIGTLQWETLSKTKNLWLKSPRYGLFPPHAFWPGRFVGDFYGKWFSIESGCFSFASVWEINWITAALRYWLEDCYFLLLWWGQTPVGYLLSLTYQVLIFWVDLAEIKVVSQTDNFKTDNVIPHNKHSGMSFFRSFSVLMALKIYYFRLAWKLLLYMKVGCNINIKTLFCLRELR